MQSENVVSLGLTLNNVVWTWAIRSWLIRELHPQNTLRAVCCVGGSSSTEDVDVPTLDLASVGDSDRAVALYNQQ